MRHQRRRGSAAAWALLAAGLAGGCNKQDSPVGPGSNRAPEIRNVVISPPSVGLGGTASVRAFAQDPDGDPLFYRYQVDAGTIVADPQQPSRATFTNTGATTGNAAGYGYWDTSSTVNATFAVLSRRAGCSSRSAARPIATSPTTVRYAGKPSLAP